MTCSDSRNGSPKAELEENCEFIEKKYIMSSNLFIMLGFSSSKSCLGFVAFKNSRVCFKCQFLFHLIFSGGGGK